MEWINVKDKLPDIEKQVIVFEPSCDPNHPEYFTMAITSYMGPKPRGYRGYWYEWPDGQDEQPGGYAPTHWRDIPEPPKTE